MQDINWSLLRTINRMICGVSPIGALVTIQSLEVLLLVQVSWAIGQKNDDCECEMTLNLLYYYYFSLSFIYWGQMKRIRRQESLPSFGIFHRRRIFFKPCLFEHDQFASSHFKLLCLSQRNPSTHRRIFSDKFHLLRGKSGSLGLCLKSFFHISFRQTDALNILLLSYSKKGNPLSKVCPESWESESGAGGAHSWLASTTTFCC